MFSKYYDQDITIQARTLQYNNSRSGKTMVPHVTHHYVNTVILTFVFKYYFEQGKHNNHQHQSPTQANTVTGTE